MYNEFVFDFKNKVQPVLCVIGYLGGNIPSILQGLADQLIMNDDYINLGEELTIDELLSDVSSANDVDKYYDNLIAYIKEHPDEFASRTKNDYIDDKSKNWTEGENAKYMGAWLDDEPYTSKVFKGETLAILVNKFSTVINLKDTDVKKVFVQAFLNRGYITKGQNSETIEKDITLSSGNQRRCYVIDISRKKLGIKTEENTTDGNK